LHHAAHSAHGTPPRPSASSGHEVRVSEIATAEARASRRKKQARSANDSRGAQSATTVRARICRTLASRRGRWCITTCGGGTICANTLHNGSRSSRCPSPRPEQKGPRGPMLPVVVDSHSRLHHQLQPPSSISFDRRPAVFARM
jgi:hypothetical protein